jgi:hypothetical protein
MSEHDDQEALFKWAEWNQATIPELCMLYAIPNGAKLPWRKNKGGQRYSPEAMKLKAEGLKSGVPDICLPIARASFHGLYIELKFGDNTTSPQQKKWIDLLRAQGYFAVVAVGWEQAARTILSYLKGNC